jgi:hypothetical protein
MSGNIESSFSAANDGVSFDKMGDLEQATIKYGKE